jgi:uncharacterized protein YdeI (YjbR/CyaY-like superfamily)
MGVMSEERKTFYPKNRKAWRSWLKKHHEKEKKIYVIKYKKHTGTPSITHKESLEEAICFGWIDTTVNRVDDKTYTRCFVRRTKTSRWSNATLGYAKDLIKRGLMTSQGLKMYHEGLAKPVIDHNFPKNPPVPEALKKLLNADKRAKIFFEAFPPSTRQYYIWWIMKAKRPKTIKKRVLETFEKAKNS